MYKFSGWMLRTGATFDRASTEGWIGARVQTNKYFLGLPAGTEGQVLGVLECTAQQFLVLVEWQRTEQATRRVDCFSRAAAEGYLQRVASADAARLE